MWDTHLSAIMTPQLPGSFHRTISGQSLRRGVKKTCRWHVFSRDLGGCAAVVATSLYTREALGAVTVRRGGGTPPYEMARQPFVGRPALRPPRTTIYPLPPQLPAGFHRTLCVHRCGASGTPPPTQFAVALVHIGRKKETAGAVSFCGVSVPFVCR